MRLGFQRSLSPQRVVVDLPPPLALELLALQPAKPYERSQVTSNRLFVAAQQLRQLGGGFPDPFDALVHDASTQAEAAPDLLEDLSSAAANLGCQ